MVEDPEIKAMSEITAALERIEDSEARTRILSWATTRFAPNVRVSSGGGAAGRDGARAGGDGDQHGDDGAGTQEYAVFVDLFDAARPRTEPERALVGGYWFQVVQGASDFPSMSVNNALKDIGHGVSNITDALSKLQNRKPAAQIRQVAKSGRSRQGRKRYKLTTAGVAEVKRMLGVAAEE